MDAPMEVRSLESFARAVRARFDRRCLPSEGNCRDLALATALAFHDDEHVVALCVGEFHDGVEGHSHYWCRCNGWIVDPTADQFGSNDPVLVTMEVTAKNYVESTYLCIRGQRVLELAGFARHDPAA